MKRLPRGLTALAGIVYLSTAACRAQGPLPIPFQGVLTTPTGRPITVDSQAITITLYDAPANGNVVYTENQTVRAFRGLISTSIGRGNPVAFSTVPFNVPYWVGIKVGTDPELVPRVALAAVPFAKTAERVADNSITATQLASSGASLAKVSGGAMTNAGGFIGIGTTSPGRKLDVDGGVAIRGGNVLEFGAGIAGKEGNAGKIGYGTFTVDTLDIVGAGPDASQRRIKFHAEGGAAFSGQIDVAGSGSFGGNLYAAGNGAFGGWVGTSGVTPQAPMHVKGNQNVLILEGADHAYMEFYPRGFYTGRKGYFGFPSAGSHDIQIANEDGGNVEVVGTFVNHSDARMKTNVAPLHGALDSVLHLRGVSYDWRKDIPGVHLSAQRQVGFLAQDVEKVLPDLVYTDVQGGKSVAYVSMIPVLVEAIKQQQAEIRDLKAEVARLSK